MFRREVHRAMQTILEALDPDALDAHGFALGGATRIALAHGEVRESADLDFVGSDARRYAALRSAVRDGGYGALFRATHGLELPREPTSDQYGIRFPVRVGARTIKVELIHEGRITLAPAVREAFSPVPLLALRDCFVEKLLANSDRGADPTQFDRDLIDLAVLREHHGRISDEAWRVAESAYGPSVRRDLEASVRRFQRDPERRARDYAALRVDDAEQVDRGVEGLAGDLGVEPPTSD